ncbi:DUF3576 domain-containing protein [Pseudorhodobacter turbinis]|uniref:DUF3576 domain-containing protein n=1 Tax=Pseudorhodobacter turbinis TaxID=2500533 RepID=A0A4P8EFP2_9RHOB|nr:DUF3576 domain-containing protein [Pseudorhodobacter turbinis]QCO55688.1 DUF3576 domain-containing protein [Pseudorhodobacter turbinis]
MSLFLLRATVMAVTVVATASCGGGFMGGPSDPEAVRDAAQRNNDAEYNMRAEQDDLPQVGKSRGGTVWDLFRNADDPNTTVEVNKYIWNASLDILNFLPVQTVDPFTGVIVTGYGVPPGGGRAYRATVYVQDPALDARSLKLSLQTRGGASVSRDTQRAVEDAILTRARQLRIRDSKL